MTLEEAYRKWADELVRYAAALVPPSDAPDIVADAFAVLLGRPEGAWSAAHNPRSYLFGAVAHRARMHHRSTSRRRTRTERVETMRATAIPDLECVDSDDAVLSALTQQQRAVVYLTYWNDMTPDDIALALSVSEGTVRKQLARARERLRKELG